MTGVTCVAQDSSLAYSAVELLARLSESRFIKQCRIQAVLFARLVSAIIVHCVEICSKHCYVVGCRSTVGFSLGAYTAVNRTSVCCDNRSLHFLQYAITQMYWN